MRTEEEFIVDGEGDELVQVAPRMGLTGWELIVFELDDDEALEPISGS